MSLVREPYVPAACDEASFSPEVGHFGQMMRALDQMEVRTALLERIGCRRKFSRDLSRIGVRHFTSSEEAPEERGLGIFEGQVQRFRGEVRIPHMGWDQLQLRQASCLLRNVGEQPYVYFAHSYYVPLVAAASASCDYTLPYTAVFEHQNICGVQFHPEKSGATGLQIVRNFVTGGAD